MATPALLGLPPELQIRIYRLLLGQRDRLVLRERVAEYAMYGFEREEWQAHVALLRTCREIYSIAKPILYGSNTLIFFAGCTSDRRNMYNER